MPLDEALWEIWKYGGSAVVAAVLTAALLKAQGVRSEVATHDRLAGYIDEDLSRWVRDRESAAVVRVDEIRQDAASKGVTSSRLLAQSRGMVYKHVLHECRDEALRKLRSVDELTYQEGRLHTWCADIAIGPCGGLGWARTAGPSSRDGALTLRSTCRGRSSNHASPSSNATMS